MLDSNTWNHWEQKMSTGLFKNVISVRNKTQLSPFLVIHGRNFRQSRDRWSCDSLRREFCNFLTKKVLRIRRVLQHLQCEKHVHTNHLTRTRTTPDLRKCKFYHSSPCSWSNYGAFIWYGLGQLLLYTIYVNIKCLQFNLSCHVVFLCQTSQC